MDKMTEAQQEQADDVLDTIIDILHLLDDVRGLDVSSDYDLDKMMDVMYAIRQEYNTNLD
jgi:hypothetical protein